MADAVGGFELGAPFTQPVAVGAGVEDLACAVVQPVLPRRAAVTGLELAAFGVEIAIAPADPVDDLAFDPAGNSGQDVDQAVRVGGDEIDGGVASVEVVHRGRDWHPPAAGVACVAEVAATDLAEHDAAFVPPDPGEVEVEVVTPRFAEPPPVVRGRTRRLPCLFV